MVLFDHLKRLYYATLKGELWIKKSLVYTTNKAQNSPTLAQ